MKIADAVHDALTAGADSWLRTGTVVDASDDPMLVVSLDGANLSLPKIGSYYQPASGDVVAVLCAPGRQVVIGEYGTGTVARLPGRVASVSFNANGPTGFTAETVTDSVTFTAVTGRRYKVTWHGSWVANTALVTNNFKIRYSAGTSLSTAGTLVHARNVRSWATAEFLDITMTTDVTGIPAGQTTIGVTSVVGLGSGTVDISGASDNLRKLIVEDIGT